MWPDDPETSATPEGADADPVAAQWSEMLAQQQASAAAGGGDGDSIGGSIGGSAGDPLSDLGVADDPAVWGAGEPMASDDENGASRVQPLRFAQIDSISPTPRNGSIDLLLDVKLPISVELGRVELPIKEIMAFSPGTIVQLNKMAGDMVDVLVNGRLVAQGEVVVVDEHFGVRVTHLLSPEDRVKSLA